MTVEIGTEAAQFPEREYINGIFVAVYFKCLTLINHGLDLTEGETPGVKDKETLHHHN
jgi:hypothetical protein